MEKNRMPSQRGGEDECCGKCLFRESAAGPGWYCMNEEADAYLEPTPYDYSCIDFEPKT